MLSVQQQLALEQSRMAMNKIDQAGDILTSRAVGLLQASSLLLVLVGVVRLPSFLLAPHPAPWAQASLAVAFLAFAGMIGLFIFALLPRTYPLPGTNVWEEIFDGYLNVSEDACFDQVLSDTLRATELMASISRRKAFCLQASLVLFLLQVVGLLGLALTG